MMEAVREVTVWTGVDYRAPNHDYLLDGDRIVAYRPWGTAEIRTLKTGIKIDRRGRKFEKLMPNPFEIPGAITADPTVVEVQGSKGQIYRVDTAAGTCTCQGFTFRGQCKHLAEIG
jgi:hypothetical protein